MFSVEQRDRARARILELARADPRVVAAAEVGGGAGGGGDRWSDLDLTFAVAAGAAPAEVLDDWAERLARELGGVHLFDLPFRSTTYRVFLLPGALQVDLSVTPAAEFAPFGPRFELLFGTAGPPRAPEPPSPGHLFGLAVHHVVRARVAVERGRPWQAAYWIGGVRDEALALACRRRGLAAAEARGIDELPAEVLASFEGTLARSLEREELLRALAAAAEALLAEATGLGEIVDRVEPELRALLAGG